MSSLISLCRLQRLIWDLKPHVPRARLKYKILQVFLTMRAVYLLVLDLSKSLDEFVVDTDFPLQSSESQGKTVKEYADFW